MSAQQQSAARELRIAVATLLSADTVSSPIDSIAGAVLSLSVGEGVKWTRRDIVNFGSTGANDELVASVTAVSGDDVTLSVTPGAFLSGDTIGGGMVEWIRPAAGAEALVYSIPLTGADPADNITDASAGPQCIIRVGAPLARRTALHRTLVDIRVRMQGRDLQWLEGCSSRAAALLTGALTALRAQLPAGWSLRWLGLPTVAPVANTSGIYEFELQQETRMAAAVAA